MREYFRLLNRRKGVVAGVFLLVLVCVCLYLFQVTPLYTAKAQLTLDLRKTRVTNIEEVVSGLSSESSVIGTEMDILQSSSLVGRVVDKLRLTKDPRYNPSLGPDTGPGLVGTVTQWAKSFWRSRPRSSPLPKRLKTFCVYRL